MVPSPSTSSDFDRRRFFLGVAGVSTVVVGGTVAIGATEPTALPDALTDKATDYYPTPPEMDTLWRPTVTEDHAKEAVELLADVVSRGERLWKRLETGGKTDELFTGAGGWLESAREDLDRDNYHDALFDATYGMQFAGKKVGFARAKLDIVDFHSLAERGYDLLDRIEAILHDCKPYRVADPGRDLAWYYRIEKECYFGRLSVKWDGMENARNGVDEGEDSELTKYDPREVGNLTSGLLRAEISVRNAERFHALLSKKVGDGGTRYDRYLERTVHEFRTTLNSLPTREAALSDVPGREDADSFDALYGFARQRLARSCFRNYSFPMTDGLLVYRAVNRSKAVAERRAHSFAVRRLVVERGDEGFDSGHVLAEKRRARKTYESVVGSQPPPLLTVQVRRAVEDLQVAKVDFGGHSELPVWQNRLEAYLYALVGRAKLQKYPAVYDAIVNAQ